jgi:energy-coupling factor transport system ATP-binding protein
MILLNDVSFAYPGADNQVFRRISLKIEPSSRVVVTGPDGSGKTTLGRLIKGLIKPNSGSITVEGCCVRDTEAAVGYVAGDPFEFLIGPTVEEDIVFGLEILQLSSQEMKDRLLRFLSWVGLSGMEKRLTHTLSGGELQKLALASVLVMEPRVIVLDEAMSMLDRPTTQAVRSLINFTRTEHDLTLIEMTHNPDDIMNADRIVFLHNQEVGFDGSPTEFLETQLGRNWIWLTDGLTPLRSALSGWGRYTTPREF